MTFSRSFALMVLMGGLMPVAHSAQSGPYVEELSCTRGPYRLRLPESATAIPKLGPMKKNTVLETYDWGTYRTHDRKLSFEGLDLFIVTFSDDPNRYVVAGAIVTSPAWKLAGQFRVGNSAASALSGLPVESVPQEGELEFAGDADFIRVTIAAGRVKMVMYSCYTG